MYAHHDGPDRGLLDEALFADEPPPEQDLTAVAVETLTPDETPAPVASVRDGGVSYSLTNLAPGLYEVTVPSEPARAEHPAAPPPADPPPPVQVEFPSFDLDAPYSALEPEPAAYEWPEDDAGQVTVFADEPTVEIPDEDVRGPEPAPLLPLPAPRRPLVLAVNAGLTVGPGGTVALTANELCLAGADPFLIDILLMSAPQQGALLRDGFALTGGDVFTQEDIDHGRIVYRHEGDVGEDTFVFATPEEEVPATTFVLRVEPARSAPELLGPGRLASPLEGARVADLLLDTVRSHEPGVAPGVALTGLTGRGQWEYSDDGGASWQPIGDVGPARALLLGPNDTIRFVPRPGWAGRVQLAYRGWDRSAGEAGARADLSAPGSYGGATAFSASATSVAATVLSLAVPDPWREAPTMADLIGEAAAVVRLEGAGVWQFSLDDGRSWRDFGVVYHGQARLLRGQDRVRFLPAAGASGKVALSARPWDGSGWGAGSVVNLAGHRAVGDGTAFGSVSQTRAWRLPGE